MGFKMGVAGCGSFGNCFVPLFKAHPLVDEVVIADLVPERVEEFSNKYGTGLMQLQEMNNSLTMAGVEKYLANASK